LEQEKEIGLDNDASFMVVLAELRGGTTFFTLENAIEITQVVETTVEGNFGDATTGINKQACCITQTDINNVIGKITTGMKLKETAEG
jgi:hypothetical protein